MEAAPALIVGLHRRGETAFQNGLQHGLIALSLGWEGAAEGHRQIPVGLIEPCAGFRANCRGQAGGHHGVGHAFQEFQVLLVLPLEPLLRRRRAGRIPVIHLGGEVVAPVPHPFQDGIHIQGFRVIPCVVELKRPDSAGRSGVDVLGPQLAQVRDPQQRIADKDLVVDEAEGLVLVQGYEPQGELAHLHGHLVDVHPV